MGWVTISKPIVQGAVVLGIGMDLSGELALARISAALSVSSPPSSISNSTPKKRGPSP